MVEQEGYRFLPLSTNGQDCTCHTVGNLVQFKVTETNVSGLDGKPFGMQSYDLFVAVWDGLLDFFFWKFIERICGSDLVTSDDFIQPHRLFLAASRNGPKYRMQTRYRFRKTDKGSLIIPICSNRPEKIDSVFKNRGKRVAPSERALPACKMQDYTSSTAVTR